MSGPSLGHGLQQRQSQSLVLAPQLRQSLKILQVGALELRSVIQEELQSNPTIEELPMEGVNLDEPSNSQEYDSESIPQDTLNTSESVKSDEMDFSKEFQILENLMTIGAIPQVLRPEPTPLKTLRNANTFLIP